MKTKMKTKTNIKPASRLTPDSQSRLVAYTAAAGLGAFFGGQTVEGQVTESHALAGYPATLSDPQAEFTWSNEYFYLCLLYTSPSPRDRQKSRMPSSA